MISLVITSPLVVAEIVYLPVVDDGAILISQELSSVGPGMS